MFLELLFQFLRQLILLLLPCGFGCRLRVLLAGAFRLVGEFRLLLLEFLELRVFLELGVGFLDFLLELFELFLGIDRLLAGFFSALSALFLGVLQGCVFQFLPRLLNGFRSLLDVIRQSGIDRFAHTIREFFELFTGIGKFLA